MWQRVGVALQVLGIALGVIGYLVSQRTGDTLTASTAINIALGGVILAVVGSAIFLRYSLTGFLRFWLARQSFELNMLAERGLAEGLLARSAAPTPRPAANTVTGPTSTPHLVDQSPRQGGGRVERLSG